MSVALPNSKEIDIDRVFLLSVVTMVIPTANRCLLRKTSITWPLALLMIFAGTTIVAFPTRRSVSSNSAVVSLRRSLPQQPQQQKKRQLEQTTTEDDDEIEFGAADTGSASTRVVIEPFQLKLSKYSSIFTESELYALRDTMEYVALTDIKNFTGSTSTPMGQIELIKFGGAKQVYISDYQVILVKFDFGIAQYNSLPIPSAVAINEWIGMAFTTKLLPKLKSKYPNSTFTVLENVSYGLQYPQDPSFSYPNSTSTGTSNSSSNGTDVTGDGGTNTTDETSSSSKSSSRSNIPLIAGVAVGGAACMMFILLGLVAKQRRDTNRRGSSRELTHTTLDLDPTPSSQKKMKKQPRLNGTNSAETSPSSSKGGGNSTSNNNNKVDTTDVRSVADSESEWTVATEAGDTMALKNIATSLNSGNENGPSPTNWSNSKNDRQVNLVLSESFERDRTVAITKDMLTGQWSGRVSNHRGGGGSQHHQSQSESVLQPSHFSASHERRIRKAQRAAAAATAANGSNNTVPMPDRETSSVSSRGDESSVDESLVFEQAHEDTATSTWAKQQKEQVSPSNTSKRRTRDMSPLPPSNNSTRQIA